MEVLYQVKQRFNTRDKTKDEMKKIFNRKLLNVIEILEKQGVILKK